MKAYWRSGGIVPRILDLGTRRRWVVSFTPRPLYSQGKNPGIHWIRGWVDPRAGLDAVVKRKIPPVIQPVAQLSWLPCRICSNQNWCQTKLWIQISVCTAARKQRCWVDYKPTNFIIHPNSGYSCLFVVPQGECLEIAKIVFFQILNY
jgi:hypothetical protein